MKILWIVNTIFPYPSKKLNIENTVFGGWLNGLAERMSKNEQVELGVATTYKINKVLDLKNERIRYFIIPNKKQNQKYWKEIIDKFQPDLIHLHGTEYSHGWQLMSENKKYKIPIITSIQGLVYRYADVYLANIDNKEIIKNITFRDILKNDSMFKQKKKFINKGKIEKKIIENSDVITGRTTWDYANTYSIKPDINYYLVNEILRSSFYYDKWDITKIERHSVFTSQGQYPIKGLHYLLKTIYILKKIYPDVKLYVGGVNIIDSTTIFKKIKLIGYAKYIKKSIKRYNLEENIIFTGLLNEKQIKEKLLRTNVFVLPSAIENSSNSLGEAMILGMPCVATNTGGTMDILKHKKEGFLYPYTEPAMCAEYIKRFFEDDELCKIYGEEARKTALERHDPEKNVKELIEIYKKTIKNKELECL